MRELLPWEFASASDEHTILILGTVLIPMILATALFIQQPPNRKGVGALALSTSWNAVWLLAGNELAVHLGWWTFESAGPQIGNVPVALWIGWVFLWGPIAAQLPFRPLLTLALLGAIDLVAMPLMDSVVTLNASWLVGEVVLLAFVAWPGLLLAKWMRSKERLRELVVVQVAMFAGILFWFIPHLAVKAVGHDLALNVSPWAYGIVLATVGAGSIPALVSVHDFYLNGGSPWPWDSTDRPVLSGPYRYLRSPMQASALLVLLTAAGIYGQWPIAVSGIVSLCFAAVFCKLEEEDLAEHFGPSWSRVVADQHRWLPSVAPHRNSERAVVWINQGCDSCAPIAQFLLDRNPIQLEIRWAHEHPNSLRRLRYERADGVVFDGERIRLLELLQTKQFARGFGHNLQAR